MSEQQPAVVTEGLRKRYGQVTALDGVDLSVPAGTVCGLLGPNGAGKTTAVRVLSTLVRPDAGRAEVAGVDVVGQPRRVRTRIGLVGQHPAVDEVLSGQQNLRLFGRLYHLRPSAARRRADELLERFDLADSGTKPVRQYSGGMRRRLDIAASLILAPRVLFLDEPTTGLDPRGRNEVWHSVRSMAREGTTVILTTQYLDEADQLADHICVLDTGRVIARGSPRTLKSRIGGDRIDVTVRSIGDLDEAARLVARAGTAQPEVDVDDRSVSAPVSDQVLALTETARGLHGAGIAVEDIGIRRPTLDEVFLQLTGHRTDSGEPTTNPTPDVEVPA